MLYQHGLQCDGTLRIHQQHLLKFVLEMSKKLDFFVFGLNLHQNNLILNCIKLYNYDLYKTKYDVSIIYYYC